MKILDIDVFYIQLIKSVDKWYRENYMEINTKKDEHLTLIGLYYNRERFRNAENLYKERTIFLNEIHVIMWESQEVVNF